MEFYVLIDGQKSGPHSPYDLNGMVRDKVITKETKGWHSGMDEWKPLGEIPAVDTLFKEPEPRVTVEEAAAAQEKPPLPVFNVCPWRRFFARLIDLFVFLYAISFLRFEFGIADKTQFYYPGFFVAFSIFASWIFIEAALLGSLGTTPGKLLLNLRIVPVDGVKISIQRGFKRSLLVWFRGFGMGLDILFIIFSIISFQRLKQTGTTVWDKAAGTRIDHGPMSPVRIILIIFLFMALQSLVYSVVGEPPPPPPLPWVPKS